MRRLLLPVLVCVSLVAAGCGGDDDDAGSSDTTATAAATQAQTAAPTATGCTAVPAAEPKQVEAAAPKKQLARTAEVTVTLKTNCGEIPILLDTARAPKTASSFAQLARDGFYDGLPFHRVIPGFVVQGGDPAGNGTGGPGYSVVERPPGDVAYTRGIVAMAKTEVEKPGTSGSQFYIVSGEDAGLPPDYAIVGKVTGDGMNAVDKIQAVPTDAADMPTEPVVIESATVGER